MLAFKYLWNRFKHSIIRVALPFIINFFYFLRPRRTKTLLIIKTDGIGDYILFRNYIRFLKESAKYNNFKIYILGNISYKDLALHLDSQIVDGYFWYSDDYFLKWKLVKLLLNLQQLRLDTIIYPNYSRKYTIDWLINNIRSNTKIGVDGNLINQTIDLKHNADRFFSDLIQVNDVTLHEFERNKEIFELITGEKCNYKRPVIEKANLGIQPNRSIIIFPGGSNVGKKWSVSNYNKLCQLIVLELDVKIILAGGKGDITEGQEISEGILTHLTNQIGKLNLVELCQLIGSSDLLISNDTSAVHIAVALNVPVVSISKGDLFGRFLPYPYHICDKIISIFPKHSHLTYKNYNEWSSYDLDDVHLEDVYRACRNILKSKTDRIEPSRS